MGDQQRVSLVCSMAVAAATAGREHRTIQAVEGMLHRVSDRIAGESVVRGVRDDFRRRLRVMLAIRVWG